MVVMPTRKDPETTLYVKSRILRRWMPINYRKPPKPTAMVRWSKRDDDGNVIEASFRSIAHMDRLNRLVKRRFGVEIRIIQPPYNTGVPQSVGTHDYDAVWDIEIPGVNWYEAQRFLRAHGFACWVRKPPDFSWHIHGFTLPPREGISISDDFMVAGFKVGKYVDGGYSTYGHLITSSQIDDYYHHALGLAGQHTTNGDKTWFPENIEATIFDLDQYIDNRLKEAA